MSKNIFVQTVLTMLLLCLSNVAAVAAKDHRDPKLKQFEDDAYKLRSDLLHNHTYDLANIKKADSLYKKSVEMKSIHGQLYALQIRTYAYAGNDKSKEFFKTVNEYIRMALDNELYDEYFDAASAKTQYLIGLEEYTKGLFEAKDMVATAEKVHNLNGIYESNLLLGQIHKYRSSWLTATHHLRKSLDAIKKTGANDSIPYCLIYREMSECYSGANNPEKALEYALLAKQWASYEVYRNFAEWTYLSAIYNSWDMQRFKKAYENSPLRSKKVQESLPEDMAVNLRIMVSVANGNYDEARRLHSTRYSKRENASTLSSIYYIEGNYKKAFECLVQHQTVTDSVENLLQQDELNEMEARLGTATLRIEAEEAKSHQRQILMASVTVLMVFIICTMIYLLRKRHRQNMALYQVNRAIEMKNNQLTAAQAETKAALVKAENANAMRSRFIENMMHEIRTPLNAISGFTQVLANPDIPVEGEMATEMRNIIMSNTESLATMLDQIIHLSAFDSGSETVTKAETTLSTIVADAVEQTSNTRDDIKLSVNAVEATIMTDGRFVAEALSVLIHNAFKYTSEGSITVEASVMDANAYFSVTDTGIGIEEDKAEKIFERFYKVDEFVPGTGLGLSLCRAIVTTLGGTVVMDTTHAAPGCRFIIILPLK